MAPSERTPYATIGSPIYKVRQTEGDDFVQFVGILLGGTDATGDVIADLDAIRLMLVEGLRSLE